MNPNRLEVPVQVRLAALWASAMFLYVYVDIKREGDSSAVGLALSTARRSMTA